MSDSSEHDHGHDGDNNAADATPLQTTIDAAQVQVEMAGNIREFVRNALMQRTFQLRHYQRAALVANRMGGAAHLRGALVALDAADWDVGGALQQHDFDIEDRRQAAQTPPQQGRDSNRGLDRSRASGGPNWDLEKLTLRVKGRRGFKELDYQDIDNSFNVPDPSPIDILRLNRWRHALITREAGLPRSHQGNTTGEVWHPATVRDIRQRFLDRMRANINNPGYGTITQEHNRMFRDVLLPGMPGRVPERSHAQVSSALDRSFYRTKYRHKKLSGVKKRRKMVEEIEKVEKRERRKCRTTDERAFNSTVEEMEAVMAEEMTLQEDTESDNEVAGEDEANAASVEGGDEESDAPGGPEDPEVDEEGNEAAEESGSEYHP